MRVLKVFKRGSKLMEYCKTYKSCIADTEIIKKKGKKIEGNGSHSKCFRIPGIECKNKMSELFLIARKLQNFAKRKFLYVKFYKIKF